ncbi:hypothetical protein E0Z10_g5551 [Xylaria hypoxylon]|uniref:Terpene cyclase/mutase family member n=1 Tax=Xylaria hypoxylon TaxID=37992 RepID=A0A4Z0YFU1_9PEZI|nr:hypothetical protein E0Z10_g5551 [Xylaria hypoxylon]
MAPSFTITVTSEDVSSVGTAFRSKIKSLEKDNEHYEEKEWTDLHRWRLHAENGRHTWKYLESDQDLLNHPEQTFRETYWLGLEYEEVLEHQKQEELSSNLPQPEQHQQTIEALKKGSNFLRQLQMEDGSWGSNCDGPMFITSGIVFACYIVGIPLPRPVRQEMCRYLVNTCNDDGGWGIYLSGPSTVFGTGINYVMLRLLGLGPEHPTCKKARDLLTSMGGVAGIPTWGRFWLCVMNLYDWDGIVPLPSEILLTPTSFQLNPANWWMPIRNIYMGMCYLYGHRFQAREDDLIRAIRGEIYAQKPYSEITNWSALRSYINATDLVKPKSLAQSAVVSALGLWEWCGSHSALNWLRTRGLKEALFQVEADVHSTEYCSYSPAYWSLDIIVLFFAHGPDSHWVQCMTPHFADGLWMCREGLAASGTDGNAVWETSLSMQAICSSMQLSSDNVPASADLEALNAALEFLADSQLLHDPIEIHRTNRHPTKGGWPYSTHSQGYIVSDCTAETILAILHGRRVPSLSQRIPIERLELAVDSLIGLESGKSGFGAYEQVRGWELLEYCNITDTYEDCMVERRYAETTGSVMTALTEFNAEYPKYREDDIRRCIDGGAAYLLRTQYHHGGWIGTWGVCFTFATMWALEGLACAGYTEQNSPAVARACAFLLRHQNPDDGGWGEALESYKAKDYIAEPEGSQVPNTAYAIISLLAAQCTNRAAIERGVSYLTKTQQPNGEWLPGTLEGIYTPPCGYRYPLYKFHFTLKALAGYARRYGNNLLSRARHIKCDETKPHCRRCLEKGRACDGYSAVDGNQQAATAIIASPITAYAIPFRIPGSRQDRQLLHYFCVRGAADLPDHLSSEFWTRLVLQHSHDNVPVCQAVVALSCAHQCYTTAHDSDDSVPADAIVHYSRAMRSLRKYMSAGIGNQEGVSGIIPLICSVLFFCFETTQGNTEAALRHLNSGIAILARQREVGRLISESRDYECLELLEQRLARLDLQASMFDDARLPLTQLSPAVESKTSAFDTFKTINDAQAELTRLQNRMLRFLISNNAFKFWSEQDLSERVKQEKQAIETAYTEWNEKLDQFVRGQSSAPDEHSDYHSSSESAERIRGEEIPLG